MQEPNPPANESAPNTNDGSGEKSDGEQTINPVPQIISIELRVLGALMEKELTTPDQYPLTLNSLITACNQKSSRDPVTQYSQGEVVRALQELQHRRFVDKEFGSRAEKYSQRFIRHLELGKKHQALLCVMMLRGPQTLSELNTRTQRMVDFAGKEDLEHTLDRLCNREVPYVVRLSQRPGQRGERFAHLFSGSPAGNPVGNPVGESVDNPVAEPITNPSTNQSGLHEQIDNLQEQIAVLAEGQRILKEQVAELRKLNGLSTDGST